ncbi:hypothetical protein A2331_05700 [Candidatus Falkowbacteria bacterium RIFOXYB2_FULL_34_18]|uniref:Thioredoxin domain-containing protein n=1 Tax=Candidatus Falkowbacteria bacterium RIFOXYD2_FULL_34_120 TaxID=1798007 RepID=A0A1F5TLV8_9BACT|nr:MAG: hypothetical protein A2331_05700 [Candidatus Falkowbacteria bacterium RIFOXYB2_FULL_34_18]OGF29142.1 MAG: hypothetical protein A2500_05645 [Candidatus Falkowbacteria bacterium RIFOXYC12_FULL_34_55]OGF36948.1 MAG: hypothetical protein A2466_07025 [Candidatus Falkowbacteria bacterium RIFOXYC2_FULL_34_220]OGF38664.1 MAG: hypothetical protein A2515_01310 [Candidatus Falkowbacteria bacterium RIFOXYD12_FULL_34_57]OGF39898.1 MAG: hypothetical protein A2531_01565 [Candidatus Falkowbacteria bact
MLNKINKNKWKIIIIFIVLVCLSFAFAGLFYLSSLISNNYSQNTENTIGIENNYWLGSANPKIVIIEFADFACPYCRESFSKIREIGIKYKKDVKIIYKDFPVLTDYSTNLALAGKCAGEQGMFWIMHDKLFLNQGVSTKTEIFELANQIGLENIQFRTCFNSKKYIKEIEQDLQIGKELEITGTPSWFINGEKIEGDIPYDIFIQIIEKLIK